MMPTALRPCLSTKCASARSWGYCSEGRTPRPLTPHHPHPFRPQTTPVWRVTRAAPYVRGGSNVSDGPVVAVSVTPSALSDPSPASGFS